MAQIIVNFSRNSKEMPDNVYDSLFDLSDNGIEIYPKGSPEEIPIPWDAAVYVEKGYVILDGAMAPGGSLPRSTCVCKMPVEDAAELFNFTISPEDEESDQKIREIFTKYSWL